MLSAISFRISLWVVARKDTNIREERLRWDQDEKTQSIGTRKGCNRKDYSRWYYRDHARYKGTWGLRCTWTLPQTASLPWLHLEWLACSAPPEIQIIIIGRHWSKVIDRMQIYALLWSLWFFFIIDHSFPVKYLIPLLCWSYRASIRVRWWSWSAYQSGFQIFQNGCPTAPKSQNHRKQKNITKCTTWLNSLVAVACPTYMQRIIENSPQLCWHYKGSIRGRWWSCLTWWPCLASSCKSGADTLPMTWKYSSFVSTKSIQPNSITHLLDIKPCFLFLAGQTESEDSSLSDTVTCSLSE